MTRLLIMLIVLLAFGVAMPGCSDAGPGEEAAAKLDAQEGRRPKGEEKKAPPGPASGGFEQGEDSQVPPGQAPGGGG